MLENQGPLQTLFLAFQSDNLRQKESDLAQREKELQKGLEDLDGKRKQVY